jgi:hypothetical protein
MPKSYDTATAELSMTLSTVAYVDENRIASQQQMINEINAGLDEAGYKSWQVARRRCPLKRRYFDIAQHARQCRDASPDIIALQNSSRA